MPSARPVLLLAALSVAVLAFAGLWAHFGESSAGREVRPHVPLGLAGLLLAVVSQSWLGLYAWFAARLARRVSGDRVAGGAALFWALAAILSATLALATGGPVATGSWPPVWHRVAALSAPLVQIVAIVRLSYIHARLGRTLRAATATS